MTLRAPTMLDFQFLKECYADWPVTEENGPITDYELKGWIRRWMHRNDEVALIAEIDAAPVGLVMYRPMFVTAQIDNLVVHPDQRNRGYSKIIREELKNKSTAEGVVVATFETLPGPFEGRYPGNVVTWDMEV